jgi:hypothetical protein
VNVKILGVSVDSMPASVIRTMSSKKTPEEDFKRFEDFIDGMEDIEFGYWFANEASPRQRQLVSEMRERIDEDDADKLIEEHRDSLRNFYSRWLR